ncbi:ribonuclease Z [Candidatus Woesearchaeota archaeon]|nr:ribonuclease Z [Candidatus Woesearchaeota archaeon]
MEITILGTSSMIPTKERNHSATVIYHEKESLLFDCGEGTQRQMKIAGIDINRISKIFITHWHGDHVLGLPGLIQTMCAQNYSGKLQIFGPKGTKKHFDYMLKAFEFDLRIELEIHEVSNGTVYKSREYDVEALEMEHSVLTVGYAIIENPKRKMDVKIMKELKIPKGPLWAKLQNGHSVEYKGKKITPEQTTKLVPGKKISYITDTRICDNAVKLAENSDVLLSEATYLSEKEEKAEDYLHLTAQQAAQLASQANVKKLVLMHFSARYKSTKEIEEEAKTHFPNTICAHDFMKIKV